MLRMALIVMTLLTGTLLTGPATDAFAQAPGLAWKTSWAASAQGPYPIGNPSAQPDQHFAFPDPALGAVDQSFRMILRPSLWGRQTRTRSSDLAEIG